MLKWVLGVATLIGGIAGVIYLIEWQFELWAWLADSTAPDATAPISQSPPTSVAATPTLSPTITPRSKSPGRLSSEQLIAQPRSARTVSGRDRTALEAAAVLVNRGEYTKAIEAALEAATEKGKAEALGVVSEHAVKEKLFSFALDAVNRVRSLTHRDLMKLETFCAIKDAALDSFRSRVKRLPAPVATFPSMREMSDAALSGGTPDGDDRASRKAAEIAVIVSDYEAAIKSASASPGLKAQSKALMFVARCAIEDGLFKFAADAASEIKLPDDRADVTVEVVKAQRVAEAEPFSWFADTLYSSCRF